MTVEDRGRVAAWIVLAAGVVLVLRLLLVQVIAGEELRQAGRGQHERSTALEPRRGSIYDRDLRPMAHTVADSSPARGSSAVPLSSRGGRVYEGRRAAAHVIGFIGKDGTGLEGIELERDSALTGVAGRALLGRFADQRTIELERRDPVDGGHVITSLDLELQQAAHRALRRGVTEQRAQSGSAVVLDPISGELLALANFPSYDPGAPGRSRLDARRNRAITDALEPGSVFKMVAFAAAIEEGLIAAGSEIDCGKGRIRIGRHTIRDVHRYRALPFEEVLVQSSNVGTIRVAERVGSEMLYRYAKDFGFGEPTGVDLPGEARGILNGPGSATWSGLSRACLAIGQEVSVTTLQMACAMGVFAADGILVEPHLVLRILGPEGALRAQATRRPIRRVVSAATADRMTRILTRAVEQGTGGAAAIEDVPIAGKTGTAQRANPAGGYEGGGYNSTFVGFLAERTPPLVIAVAVVDPQEEYFGGEVAAPIFREIADVVVSRDAVRGPRIESASALERIRVPALVGLRAREARAALERLDLRARIEGADRSGRVAQQDPAPGTALTRGASVLLLAQPTTAQEGAEDAAVVVPRLVGLTIRQAHRALLDAGLAMTLDGHGHVVGQLPAAGRTVAPRSVCALRARPRPEDAS